MTGGDYDPDFEALLELLKRARGFDFTGYKRPSLIRRMRRRMQTVGIEEFAAYQDYLETNADEFAMLFNTILINVTRFFRDADAWEYVGKEVVPRILATKAAHEPIRVWSAGCASGEEAYTAAIMLAEQLGDQGFRERVKIYATDVDEDALNFARQAAFTPKQLEDLDPHLVKRYFEPANGHPMAFRKDLRRQLIFGRHDLVQDAPISRIDLLICRNTLMYFNAETQGRILNRFHFALRETGFLFLGKVEMLLGHPELFTPQELRHRVFAKVPRPNLRERLLILSQGDLHELDGHSTQPDRLVDFVYDNNPLAQVTVDGRGFLVLASAKARTWFGLNPSDIGRPFQDLELSYRPTELRSSIEQVRIAGAPLHLRDVSWPAAQGNRDGAKHLDIELAPVRDHLGVTVAIAITFVDVTPYRRLQDELEHANSELESAYEELQSTNEELETTNEELQSTVEELETTNEELQSTNEELETMNEELQSTNDELQVMNEVLGRQASELDEVNAFLESILESLGGGIIVLDRDMHVQVWNAASEDLWGIRPNEAIGSHFLSFDIGLPVEHLATAIHACLAGSPIAQKVVLEAHNRKGQAFSCHVRCRALMRATGEVLGVILMMMEEDT